MGTDAHKEAVGVDIHVSKEAPNLIINGAFQLWINGVSSQPDDVENEGTPTVAQATGERDNFFDTPFAVRYTATGAENEGGKITLSRLKASTSYGIHIRAKATAGDTARLFTIGASVNVDQETVLIDWISLSGTFTTNATPTDVVIKFVAKNDGDIVWFDSLIVVEGDVIPTFAPQGGLEEGGDIFFNSLGVGVGASGIQGHIKIESAVASDPMISWLDPDTSRQLDTYWNGNQFVFDRTGGNTTDIRIVTSQTGETGIISFGTAPAGAKFAQIRYSNNIFSIAYGGAFDTNLELGAASNIITFDNSVGGPNTIEIKTVGLTLKNPTTGTASKQVAILDAGGRSVPADGDEGYLSLYNDDSTGTEVEFGRITWVATDVTNTTKAAGYQIELMQNDTLRDYMHFSATVGADTGTIQFNKDEQNIDYIISASGITNAFLVKGNDGVVLINRNTAFTTETLGVDGDIVVNARLTAPPSTSLQLTGGSNTSAANSLFVTPGGIVLIGRSTALSSEKLSVDGFAVFNGRLTAPAATNLQLTGGLNSSDINSLFITPGGDVGAGTATPATKLEVVGNIKAGGTSRLYFNSTLTYIGSPAGVNIMEVQGYTHLELSTYLDALESQHISISPRQVETARFNPGGTIFMPFVYSDIISGSTRDLYIKSDGQLGYLSSSIKYKKNVRYLDEMDMNYDISWLYNLRPALCDSKINNSEKNFLALIAEDVNSINSRLVSYKRIKGAIQVDGKDVYYDTEEPETVNYASPYFITSLLIAVQNLRQDVDSLMV